MMACREPSRSASFAIPATAKTAASSRRAIKSSVHKGSPSSHLSGGLTTASRRSTTGLLTLNCRGRSSGQCRGRSSGQGALLLWLNTDVEQRAIIHLAAAGVNCTRLAGWTVEAGIAALKVFAVVVCPLIEANTAAFDSLHAETEQIVIVIASSGPVVACSSVADTRSFGDAPVVAAGLALLAAEVRTRWLPRWALARTLFGFKWTRGGTTQLIWHLHSQVSGSKVLGWRQDGWTLHTHRPPTISLSGSRQPPCANLCCEEGQTCCNNRCVTEGTCVCDGGTCNDWPRGCNNNNNLFCFCMQTVEGGGVCFFLDERADHNCKDFQRCNTSLDCPTGQPCAVNTCCREVKLCSTSVLSQSSNAP